MPVSEENEQVLKGKIAPKRQKRTDEEEKDEKENERPVRPEEIAMGVGGQVVGHTEPPLLRRGHLVEVL